MNAPTLNLNLFPNPLLMNGEIKIRIKTPNRLRIP